MWEELIKSFSQQWQKVNPVPEKDRPISYHCPPCDVWGRGVFPMVCWVCGGLEQLEEKAIPMAASGQSFGPYRPPGVEDLSSLTWEQLLAGVEVPDAEVVPRQTPEEDEW